MSENKSVLKPVLTGIMIVLLLARLVYALVRLNTPAPTSADQQLQMLNNLGRQQKELMADNTSLIAMLPSKLPVPQKPVLRVNAIDDNEATRVQAEGLKGPVKTYKAYGLSSGGGSTYTHDIRVNGTLLFNTDDMAFNPAGRQTADNIFSYFYYYDAAGNMRYSEVINDAETKSKDSRRYWYDNNGNLTKAIFYNEGKDSVRAAELHICQNEYKADRTEVTQKTYSEGRLLDEELCIYDLYGNKVYKAYGGLDGGGKYEQLTEYVTVAGKQHVKSIREKKPGKPVTLTAYNEYDDAGRAVKKFLANYSTSGNLTIIEYQKNGSYTEKIYHAHESEAPFTTNNGQAELAVTVTLDKEGHELSRKETEKAVKEYKELITYDAKYDNYGNCTYWAKYTQQLDSGGRPQGKKELVDLYAYRYTYYKPGEKSIQVIPAETTRVKALCKKAEEQLSAEAI